MAPVQKLENIDLKKRTSTKSCIWLLHLLGYLVICDPVRDLRVHHH